MSRRYAYLRADYSADEHHNFAHNIDIVNQPIQQAYFKSVFNHVFSRLKNKRRQSLSHIIKCAIVLVPNFATSNHN